MLVLATSLPLLTQNTLSNALLTICTHTAHGLHWLLLLACLLANELVNPVLTPRPSPCLLSVACLPFAGLTSAESMAAGCIPVLQLCTHTSASNLCAVCTGSQQICTVSRNSNTALDCSSDSSGACHYANSVNLCHVPMWLHLATGENLYTASSQDLHSSCCGSCGL